MGSAHVPFITPFKSQDVLNLKAHRVASAYLCEHNYKHLGKTNLSLGVWRHKGPFWSFISGLCWLCILEPHWLKARFSQSYGGISPTTQGHLF